MARHTKFEQLEDGRLQRMVSEDEKHWEPSGEPCNPDDMRPREEDAYPLGGKHVAGCRGVPVGPNGIAIVVCADGCPELAETLARAEAVCREKGWLTEDGWAWEATP